MPEIPLSLAHLARALDLTEHQLRALVINCDAQAPDPTLVALTVEEAARRLGVGRTTMYALVSSGEIPSVTVGRLRRVPAEALKEFVAARAQVTPSAAALAA